MKLSNLSTMALIITIFVLFIIIICPWGEFPLNDDWSYAKTVSIFLSDYQIRFVDWFTMSFLAQLFWGVLFTKLFGFSFTILRFSTVILSIIGILCFYYILLGVGCKNRQAVFGTFLLLFNPMFVNLSFTFMTDIPFLTVSLIGFTFFLKDIKGGSVLNFFWGALFSAISVFIRQTGVMLPFGVILFYVFFRRDKINRIRICLITMPFFGLSFFYYWLYKIHGINESFAWHQATLKNAIIKAITDTTVNLYQKPVYILEILGLSLLPILIPFFIRFIKNIKLNLYVWTLIPFIGLVRYCLRRTVCIIPGEWTGNIFYNLGLGPILILGQEKHIKIEETLFSYILTFIGIICAIAVLYLFLVSVINSFKKTNFPADIVLSCLLCLGFIAFLMFIEPVFDRYALIILPFLIIIGLYIIKDKIIRFSWGSYACLFIIALFSISATQDYFAWNKAQWEGIDFLKDRGIKVNDISAGREFSCWHFWKGKWECPIPTVYIPVKWHSYKYDDSEWNRCKWEDSLFWRGDTGDIIVCFRKTFDGPVGTKAGIDVDTSGVFSIWVNGERIAYQKDKGGNYKVELRNNNVVLVTVWSYWGISKCKVKISYGDRVIESDDTWRCIPAEQPFKIPLLSEEATSGNYIVSFKPFKGCIIVKKISYFSLLSPFKKQHMYILKKPRYRWFSEQVEEDL